MVMDDEGKVFAHSDLTKKGALLDRLGRTWRRSAPDGLLFQETVPGTTLSWTPPFPSC